MGTSMCVGSFPEWQRSAPPKESRFTFTGTGVRSVPHILRGFKGAMTQEQQTFSTAMSSVRESVEWGFMLIVRGSVFVDYRKNLKIGKQPIARIYFVAALLTNMKTCIMEDTCLTFTATRSARLLASHFPSLHDYLYA